MATPTGGPERGALESSRRTLVTVASGIVTGFALLSLARVWPDVPSLERSFGLTGALVVVLGIVLSRRTAGLWAIVGGLAIVLLAAVVPLGGPPWIPVTVLSAYVVYFTVFLVSRRAGVAVPALGAIGLAALWATGPTQVIAGPLGVFGGWGGVAALLISGQAAWLAWNHLDAEARAADAKLATLEAQTAESLAVQERARAWRATATRVHESVLNTIRYVLTAPQPDRSRLAVEAESAVAIDSASPDGAPTVTSLMVAVRDTAKVEHLSVDASAPDVALEPAVWEAVRGAVVELVRNAERHSDATGIDVGVKLSVDGEVLVLVSHDGAGAPAAALPGVGSQQVIETSLREVGARLQVRSGARGGTVVTITVPRVRPAVERRAQTRAYPPFDKARLLVTAPVAGICLAGVGYFVLAGVDDATRALSAAIAGLIGIGAAVTVVLRRRRVRSWIAVPLVLVPALVPWSFIATTPTCREAAILAPVINVSGYCIMVIAAWSRWPSGLLGLSVWGSGSIVVLSQMPSTCRLSTILAVGNSLVALPLILAVSSAGARAYQRAQDRTQLTRRREIAERSRALAALDINENLQGAVDGALEIVRSVAAGEPLDNESRRELERLDGRIRAGIQVDPQSSGAMAVLAKAMVDEVSALGVTVNVRALASSADQRALPLMLQHLVYRLLASEGPVPTVLAFTDGEEDHLSLVVGRQALRDASLKPGETLEFDDVVVEVDDEDASSGEPVGEWAVLVSRAIEVPAPAPAGS